MDLLGGDGMGGLDHSLRNSAGQTVADLAAIQLAQLLHGEPSAPAYESQQLLETQTRTRHIHQLLLALEPQWERCVRPLLLRCLGAVLPVVDVARLALGLSSGAPLTSST